MPRATQSLPLSTPTLRAQTVTITEPSRRLNVLKHAGILTVTILLIGLVSCSKSSEHATPVGPMPVASVTVTPATASVQAGQTTQLTATPKDAGGTPLSGRAVTWSSDNTAAATVNASGLVRGVAAGHRNAVITATCEGKEGVSTVTVEASGTTVVFVGAGDIAVGGGFQEATAQLLDGIPGTVFTLGDQAYPDGTTSDYTTYYDPTWGRHKARTRPCPGNHDYHTANAAGYFTYFGSLAGPSGQGYYSFDLGDWHIISLDGEIPTAVGSPQEVWLRADLAAHTNQCCLAYWHEPLFDSGDVHGSQSQYVQPLWQALYDYHAEIVLNGHEHIYERFAPQTPDGTADPDNGIREFIVGTGGAGLYTVTTPKPNSEVHNTNTHGVLKLTLGPGTYSWQFIPVAGQTFTDSGSGTCHK